MRTPTANTGGLAEPCRNAHQSSRPARREPRGVNRRARSTSRPPPSAPPRTDRTDAPTRVDHNTERLFAHRPRRRPRRGRRETPSFNTSIPPRRDYDARDDQGVACRRAIASLFTNSSANAVHMGRLRGRRKRAGSGGGGGGGGG